MVGGGGVRIFTPVREEVSIMVITITTRSLIIRLFLSQTIQSLLVLHPLQGNHWFLNYCYETIFYFFLLIRNENYQITITTTNPWIHPQRRKLVRLHLTCQTGFKNT